MTLPKKYSTSIITSLIVAVLVIGISFQSSTAETEEFDYRNSAINGMQLETTFHFSGIGNLDLETFSVYRQESGFLRNDIASFRLAGLAGIDKIGLYELADRTAQQRFTDNDPLYNFDVTIKITQNDQVLHQFNYKQCRITNYLVDTLFDADETYSGKTKFAIVDIFEFECKGYEPITPLFEEAQKIIRHLDETKSSLDLIPGVTWESHPKYQSQGFTP